MLSWTAYKDGQSKKSNIVELKILLLLSPIAESLIELQRDERPRILKEKSDHGNSGEDNHHASKEHKGDKDKWKSKAYNELKEEGK